MRHRSLFWRAWLPSVPGRRRLLAGDGQVGPAKRFRALYPNPQAVLVDQYTLHQYFELTVREAWEYEGTEAGQVAVYRTNAGRVYRDQGRWNFDFADVVLYAEIAELLQAGPSGTITVFQRPAVSRQGR